MVGTRFASEDGKFIVDRSSDVEPLLDIIKQERITGDGNDGFGKMKLAARLDPIIVEKYINDNGITWSEFLHNNEHARRMCNDPALAAFRVWQGQV